MNVFVLMAQLAGLVKAQAANIFTRVKSAVAELNTRITAWLDEVASRFMNTAPVRKAASVAALAMALAIPYVMYAQSVNIDFGPEDLDVFFDWFNTIFTALLPIGLLGAGLTAGGLFVWVIAGMLISAFRSMLSSRMGGGGGGR